MSLDKRSVIITTLVTFLGLGVFWWGTDGFRAFTAETARRLEVLSSPRPLPAVILEDQDGHTFTLQEYHGRLLAVDFIYTTCAGLCRSMSAISKQIHDSISPDALGRDFSLVSISFDPERDNPANLKQYSNDYGADGKNWRFARVKNATELASLLDAFGIIVIPDGIGGYEHNAALHLVGRDGRLKLIYDITEAALFVKEIEEQL